MSTDVMETTKDSIPAQDEEQGISCRVTNSVVTSGSIEHANMCERYWFLSFMLLFETLFISRGSSPHLRKDCSSLEIESFL